MAKSRENLFREAEQKLNGLRFTDDFMFCTVLERNPNITKDILEIILGFKIKDIQVQQQKTMAITDKAKGIRADIFAEDEARNAYDLEMQLVTRRELPKRARYYQGVIDLIMLERGSSYSELRKSYVIFICMTDPFGQGQYIYTVKNSCMECNEMNYEDESYKIFINASGTKGEISGDMKAFIGLLRGDHVEHPLIDKINRAVEAVRKDEDWRNEYMTEYIYLQDIREEGREEGRVEERMTMSRTIVNNMISLGIAPEAIARLTKLSPEVIEEILMEQ